MASAKFLEEALSTDVDESAVNAIVGSLETQLVTTAPTLPGQQINSNVNNQNHINNSAISNGGPITSQKHGVANGESVNVILNSDSSKIVSTASLQSNITSTNVAPVVSATAQGSVPNHYVNQVAPSFTQTNLTSVHKNHESVKVVYPSTGQLNSNANMNNRVFTPQSLPNGLSPLSQTVYTSTASHIPNKSQPALVIKNTSNTTTVSAGLTSNAGIVTVPMNTNPAMSLVTSSSTGVMTLAKPTTQGTQLVGNTQPMVGNVQILNMRPGAPNTSAQKSVATVAPRVVIGAPHMVGARPGTPGITLQALQGLQPGQQGHLLLKTENGQFQLLRVGPAPGTQSVSQMSTQNQVGGSTQQTQQIRLQGVPSAVSRLAGTPIAIRKTIVQPVKLSTNQSTISTSNTPSVVNSQVNSVAPITVAATSVSQNVPVPALASAQTVSSTPNSPVVTLSQSAVMQRQTGENSKEKCRKFLANLLELSSREPKAVERNVRTLIQELIDTRVQPEEFCDRLEKLLNASPQPCLIGFLRKSLPFLRQSLYTKELVIEGIRPPSHEVAYSATAMQQILSQTPPPQNQNKQQLIQNQRKQQIIHQTNLRGNQLDTIRTAMPNLQPARTQQANTLAALQNRTQQQVRPQHQPIQQQQQQQQQQIRVMGPTTTASGGMTVPSQIRPQQILNQTRMATPRSQIRPTVVPHIINRTQTPQMVTQAQQIITQNVSSTNPPALHPVTLNNQFNNSNAVRHPAIARTVNQQIRGPIAPRPNTPLTKVGPMGAIPRTTLAATKVAITQNKQIAIKSQLTTVNQIKPTAKEKEKKPFISAGYTGDDDINDVATMGGVNLDEETQRILGSTELIGRQIRSCKDEVFLHLAPLQSKINNILMKHGLDEPLNSDVAALISHATQERLKNLIEKLAVIAEHRIDVIKLEPKYEPTQDVKGQLKFLEELDRVERKKHEEKERELLLRAAKSRSKSEDPEQAKLKAKAKEMQRVEMEELRQREANLTALQAIGPRKRPRLDEVGSTQTSSTGGAGAFGSRTTTPSRPRLKRVNLRDMLFVLEQEKNSCRSSMLCRAYLK